MYSYTHKMKSEMYRQKHNNNQGFFDSETVKTPHTALNSLVLCWHSCGKVLELINPLCLHLASSSKQIQVVLVIICAENHRIDTSAPKAYDGKMVNEVLISQTQSVKYNRYAANGSGSTL